MTRIPQAFEIHTPRLLLKPYERSDARELLTMIDRNRSDLLDAFPVMINQLNSLSETRAWIAGRSSQHAMGQGIAIAMRLRHSQVLAGYLGILNLDMRVPKCEMAYFVEQSLRRQGLAEEALLAGLRWAIGSIGLQKVLCRVDPANKVSLRLLEKAGFVQEGLVRCDYRSGHGHTGDCVYMGLLASDFMRANSA
jgi:ribosomal-protein-serine acetyltransferase